MNHADARIAEGPAATPTEDWSLHEERADAREAVSGHEATVAGTAAGDQPARDELAAQGRVPPAIRQRFHNLRFLGKGGMGTVYQAHDIELARDVALKFVYGAMASRLLGEARAQARVVHDNVCKIFDVGVADGQPL